MLESRSAQAGEYSDQHMLTLWVLIFFFFKQKTAYEIGAVLGLDTRDRSRHGLAALAREILAEVPISSLVVHPVAYALAAHEGVVSEVDGPYVEKPLITTGAGDHFNSGFCCGRMLDFDHAAIVLLGVAARR